LADDEQEHEQRPLDVEGAGVIEEPPSATEAARQTRENEQHEFARDQVTTNKRLAWFTGLLVVGTFIGTGISIWQATIAQTAANAARDAVKVARDTLIQGQAASADLHSQAAQARKDSEVSATRSREDSNRALQAAVNNFHHEQRAYLIPGDPEETGGYGLIRFPIINFGHTTATHLVISTHFERIKMDLSTAKSTLMDKRELNVGKVPAIPPSEKPSFYMMVFIPQKDSNDYSAELASGTQDLLARGTIKYDSGFGENDTITWCYAWHPKQARWENCGGSATAWLDSATNN